VHRAFVLALALAGCDAVTASPASQERAQASPPAATATPEKRAASAAASLGELAFPAPKRLVAIGDVHGDLARTKRVLRLAGAIDEADRWVGGDLFVVQVGDQTDRGDDDRAILDMFARLRREAKAAGGTFLALNGNHELMNAALDFRYVTPGGFAAFRDVAVPPDPRLGRVPEEQRARAVAFLPGGAYARKLAEQPIVAKVGDAVFVHGGVLPKHVDLGLEVLDKQTRAWLRGEVAAPPRGVMEEDGLVWTRNYSAAPGQRECGDLGTVLERLDAKQLVMGHTVQRHGMNQACGGAAWRIDVGIAEYYGGPVQALEIAEGKTRVLSE